MSEIILSAGIDVGTCTTSVVFSEMEIENIGGFGSVPKIEIVDKRIVYQGKIHFTPLLNEDEIDAVKVRQIIENEFRLANVSPSDVDTGCVIITGETVKKSNSQAVANELSEISGDFVVASAGADLESVLSAKGAACDKLSAESGKITANFDIGGGTTNIAVFKNAINVDTACLDIGARLIKLDENQKVTYISKKLKELLELCEINLCVGEVLSLDVAEKICEEMANVICSITQKEIYDEEKIHSDEKVALMKKKLDLMITNHGLTGEFLPEEITFSGGVAECIFNKQKSPFEFGDLGVIFARAIRKNKTLFSKCSSQAKETIRATVVGASSFSMDVSGSTIEFDNCDFPIKSLPVSRINLTCCDDIPTVQKQVEGIFMRSDNDKIALSMQCLECPSFLQIESMADAIYKGAYLQIQSGENLIIVIEKDVAKALGQALRRRIKGKCKIICIDQLSCGDGDFIDIGVPLYNGKIIPVIVKTLIFN